jgi:hypothetical protein
MLRMLSWSKDPSWRREEKEGKRHRRMNRRYHRCNSVGALGTLRNDWNSLDTVRWTDGPFPSCVGWFGEEKPRRQQRRMNRRSFGGNRWTIRWSSLNKTEMHQDEALSTGWTDGSAAVHPTVAWKLTETVWPQGLQHWLNRRCIGVMRRNSCVSRAATTKWCGGHRMIRRPEKA